MRLLLAAAHHCVCYGQNCTFHDNPGSVVNSGVAQAAQNDMFHLPRVRKIINVYTQFVSGMSADNIILSEGYCHLQGQCKNHSWLFISCRVQTQSWLCAVRAQPVTLPRHEQQGRKEASDKAMQSG